MKETCLSVSQMFEIAYWCFPQGLPLSHRCCLPARRERLTFCLLSFSGSLSIELRHNIGLVARSSTYDHHTITSCQAPD